MSDNSSIEWTDTTWIVDREGRRVRSYQRYGDLFRPGQQERRRRLTMGQKWCRGCPAWLPADAVSGNGLCRPCANADYRRRYAADSRQIRARVHARKRALTPLPIAAADVLTADFGGRCAYCPEVATTWDHVIPVADGGRTTPGNVVPACQPCNSSKGTRDVWEWLTRTGRCPSDPLIDLLVLAHWPEVA